MCQTERKFLTWCDAAFQNRTQLILSPIGLKNSQTPKSQDHQSRTCWESMKLMRTIYLCSSACSKAATLSKRKVHLRKSFPRRTPGVSGTNLKGCTMTSRIQCSSGQSSSIHQLVWQHTFTDDVKSGRPLRA